MPSWKINFNLEIHEADARIVRFMALADAMAKVIREIPITPSIKEKIDKLSILRAVQGTTGIEGAHLSVEEVANIIDRKEKVLPPTREREEKEAINAWEVMMFIMNSLNAEPNRPLTEDLVKRIHVLTTQNIDYANNQPGAYRRHPVFAGTYEPPKEFNDISSLMEKLFHWLNEGEGKKVSPIIRAIATHFYFISIHPFGDGNGRTARAIENYLLYQAQINARGFYSLSNFYYRNRSEYVRLLDHVRFESGGNLTPFIHFALQGLCEELEALHQEVLLEVRRIAFRDYAREMLVAKKKLHSKTGERRFNFLSGLVNYFPGGIIFSELRKGEHALYRFYAKSSRMTLVRDVNLLEELDLALIEDGRLKANLDIMREFTAVRPKASAK